MSFIIQRETQKPSLTDGFCIIHSDPNLLPSHQVKSISHRHLAGGGGGGDGPTAVNFAIIYIYTINQPEK